MPDSRRLYVRELSLLLVKVWPWTGSICRNLSEMQNPRDFPSGPVVNNPPCNAGDVSSIPTRGTKTPHAMEQ